jgi:hypothetical protein
MNRGPRNLRVAFDGVGLTQFGGVTLIEQFFQRLRLQRVFSRHIRFVQRNNRYSISESLEAFLYPLILVLDLAWRAHCRAAAKPEWRTTFPHVNRSDLQGSVEQDLTG